MHWNKRFTVRILGFKIKNTRFSKMRDMCCETLVLRDVFYEIALRDLRLETWIAKLVLPDLFCETCIVRISFRCIARLVFRDLCCMLRKLIKRENTSKYMDISKWYLKQKKLYKLPCYIFINAFNVSCFENACFLSLQLVSLLHNRSA